MKINSFTEKGGRQSNQDYIFIENINPNVHLILVADGMGGYESGDIAAKMVCENILTYLSIQTVVDQGTIQKAVNKSNLALRQYQSDHEIKMGATVGGIIISGSDVSCFWVGDVKIIQFRSGEIVFESRDHTLMADIVESGSIASYERIEKYKHVVTRSVHGDVKVSQISYETLGSVECGDILVICTDGVTDIMDSYSIQHDIYSSSDLDDGINKIKRRLEIEGKDNYSGVIISDFKSRIYGV
ncbi:MAG TPA: protein phosphatase 2C domain-containing protein [Saprospiraceae bacterium]|nr:protein phosphatase 2C domain-containing protein [Saprospiraceae bacterium]